jgi:hypothetical protein
MGDLDEVLLPEPYQNTLRRLPASTVPPTRRVTKAAGESDEANAPETASSLAEWEKMAGFVIQKFADHVRRWPFSADAGHHLPAEP